MKKAILVVSFGTSHLDALNNSIKKIEDSIQENFKEYDVFNTEIKDDNIFEKNIERLKRVFKINE